MLDDLRDVVRELFRVPGYLLTISARLALGIGASVAVFAAANAVLLRPLPYGAPEQLVAVTYRSRDAARFSTAVPWPTFVTWNERSRAFDGLGAYALGEESLRVPSGEPLRVSTAAVSLEFFSVLGVPPVARGRAFEPRDYVPGSTVAVVSDAFWRRHLGRDEAILGETLRVSPFSYRIVGVTPAGSRFPAHGTPDVFLPLVRFYDDEAVRFASVIGRLRRGTDLEAAARELHQIDMAAAPSYPSGMQSIVGTEGRPEVTPLQQFIAGDLRPVMNLALAAVACVLLLGCANAASILLTRTTTRHREWATRAALGATPNRLARRVLLEALLLATTGGFAGVFVLRWALEPLRSRLAETVPHAETIGFDARVFTFAAAATLLTAVLAALVSVGRLRRADLGAELKYAPGGTARGSVSDSARRALITGQVALAVLLLVGGLLLAKTLWQLRTFDLGFDPQGTLTLKTIVRGPDIRHLEAVEEILHHLRRLPGIEAAGATNSLPFAGQGPSLFTASAHGGPPAPGDPRDGSAVIAITPGYLRALGATLVAGRDFNDGDTASQRVAMVNRKFVQVYVRDSDPLHARLTLGDRDVVGVVENIRRGRTGGRIDDDIRPTVYVPFTQTRPWLGWGTHSLVVRVSGNPRGVAESVRQTILMLVPDAIIFDVQTMENRLAAYVAPDSQRAVVFGLFAIAAVALATTGLYGLLAYVVARQMHEFGIMLALGAGRGRVVGLIVRRALGPVVIGIALGLGTALLVTRYLEGLLFGVEPADPPSYLAAAGLMLVTAALACAMPARRAMNADPLAVLRSE